MNNVIMEYKIKFKKLEGNQPDENYVSLGNGLQYQGIDEAPADILLSIGVLLGKINLGHATEMLVPKGKTLEVIFKD